jgi:hypothetical protein
MNVAQDMPQRPSTTELDYLTDAKFMFAGGGLELLRK